jgi:hypothetical protein
MHVRKDYCTHTGKLNMCAAVSYKPLILLVQPIN